MPAARRPWQRGDRRPKRPGEDELGEIQRCPKAAPGVERRPNFDPAQHRQLLPSVGNNLRNFEFDRFEFDRIWRNSWASIPHIWCRLRPASVDWAESKPQKQLSGKQLQSLPGSPGVSSTLREPPRSSSGSAAPGGPEGRVVSLELAPPWLACATALVQLWISPLQRLLGTQRVSSPSFRNACCISSQASGCTTPQLSRLTGA